MIICTWCDVNQDESQFFTDPRGGYDPVCKGCGSGAALGLPHRWYDMVQCEQCHYAKQFSTLDDDLVCMECRGINILEAKRLEEEEA